MSRRARADVRGRVAEGADEPEREDDEHGNFAFTMIIPIDGRARERRFLVRRGHLALRAIMQDCIANFKVVAEGFEREATPLSFCGKVCLVETV